jgi:DNA-binding response OmpR family regulator
LAPTVKQRVLVVEDDARMLDLLCKGLREVGHTPMPASDGNAALDLMMELDFDSVILDIGLPGKDGLAVADALRATKRTPILMLTARDSEEDILRGFQFGADDYLTKPFSFREMLARLNVIGRNASRHEATSLSLDPARMIVYREHRAIQLTRSEYLLLATLHAAAGRSVDRRTLMGVVWADQPHVGSNALDVLVNALRGKIDAPTMTPMLLTVRGTGYRLRTTGADAKWDQGGGQ